MNVLDEFPKEIQELILSKYPEKDNIGKVIIVRRESLSHKGILGIFDLDLLPITINDEDENIIYFEKILNFPEIRFQSERLFILKKLENHLNKLKEGQKLSQNELDEITNEINQGEEKAHYISLEARPSERESFVKNIKNMISEGKKFLSEKYSIKIS